MSLTTRVGDVYFFFVLRLLSLPCAIFELMVPGLGRPLQLLGGEVDRF